MTSSNDHISIQPPASKSRLSPLDFRNTELVSRLLAATPPYLYNMSLIPNSYFFSEMLRSLVQAKQEGAVNTESMMTTPMQSRRSRKRPWLISRHEDFSKAPPKMEKPEVADWTKAQAEKTNSVELSRKSPNSRLIEDVKSFNKEKQSPFQNIQSDPNNPGLILPPAPPIWFPPLYPSPYVDPLHFFIDLRVSGHIYDKSQKNCANFDRSTNKDYPATIVSSNSESDKSNEINDNPVSSLVSNRYGSHNSAFSVPSQKSNNLPMNLSQVDKDQKCTKFDVKSMGFEKSSNKIGTNYIMPNIEIIYKDMSRRDNHMHISDCSEEKKSKMEDVESNMGFQFFSDNGNMGMTCHQSFSREHSPVEVVAHDDQEYKIDIQS